MKKDALIIVRGGGDLATGTIHRLWSAGLRVLVLGSTCQFFRRQHDQDVGRHSLQIAYQKQ